MASLALPIGQIDPVVPAAYDILWIVVVGAALLLFVATLVSILRSPRYTGGGKALWVLGVLAFPFAGPLVWWLGGRTAKIRTDAP